MAHQFLRQFEQFVARVQATRITATTEIELIYHLQGIDGTKMQCPFSMTPMVCMRGPDVDRGAAL